MRTRPVTPARRYRTGRITVLDGLRLAAALLVVGYHYVAFGSGWDRPQSELFPNLYRPAAYGWLGVNLFFLISGFVICMSAWGRSLSEFFTSRFIRLFPAYWVGVLCTTAVLGLMAGGYEPRSMRDILVNLTMLQEPLGVKDVDAVYWSLWAEMRFYLLFALVVWRGVTYRRVLAFCGVWAVAAVAASTFDLGPVSMLVMPGNCWYFIAGLAFYLMYRFGPNLLLWMIVGASFLIGHMEAMKTYRRALGHIGYHVPQWGVTVLLLGFFVLMAGVSLGWFSRVNWRILPTLGALTYPLYLLHEYIGWELIRRFQHDLRPETLLALLVAGALVASWLVNRLVERPASRWLKQGFKNAFEQVRLAGVPDGDPVGPGRSAGAASSRPEEVRTAETPVSAPVA